MRRRSTIASASSDMGQRSFVNRSGAYPVTFWHVHVRKKNPGP
jgi:hypothetical protein